MKAPENITSLSSVEKKGVALATQKPISKIDATTDQLLVDSVQAIADESGWVNLGHLGNFIIKKKADFDPRNYGFQKLLPLIKSTNKFEIDERDVGANNVKSVYIRVK